MDVNARVVNSIVKIHESADGTLVNSVVGELPAEVGVPLEPVKEEEIELVDLGRCRGAPS